MGNKLPLLALAAILATATLMLAGASTWMMARGDWIGGMNDRMRSMHGGGTDSSSQALSVGGMSEQVDIRDFVFTPGNLRIPAGATVTWVNDDSAPHTATAKDGSWDTGTLKKGERGSVRFEKAGDYRYYCVIHPDMEARLRVE